MKNNYFLRCDLTTLMTAQGCDGILALMVLSLTVAHIKVTFRPH
jgi:hypothetical protein